LGGSSLIFVGAFEVSLLGGMADSPLCLFRSCDFRFVGFIIFRSEDWLERMTFKSFLRSRMLLLYNFLRRSLSLQHPECG
jgi:hypothetical protein